jgi:hypothetical protein
VQPDLFQEKQIILPLEKHLAAVVALVENVIYATFFKKHLIQT